MFYLRGALVCMSMFVVVYACASIAIGLWWRKAASIAGDESSRRATRTLFALRMLPLSLGLVSVVAFAVPSFLWFEPRSEEEAIGAIPVLLAAAFAILVMNGAVRSGSALRQTRASMHRWTSGTRATTVTGAVLVNSPDAPPVALAGIASATLVISRAAQQALTPAELERAIAHENSHRRARDNFKKLLLRALAFPGMARLEREWLECIELSADADAVSSHAEALDLASALVKIARLHGNGRLPELASGLVDGPRSALQLRVKRLLQWSADPPECYSQRRLATAGAVALLLIVCSYPQILQGIHVVTELLVR